MWFPFCFAGVFRNILKHWHFRERHEPFDKLRISEYLRIQRIGFIRSWWFPPPKNGRIRTRRTWFCVAPCLSSRRARSQTGPGSPGARWCWSMWIIVERSIPRVKHSWSIAGWWFGCHQFYFRRNIGFLIIPIDSNIFYRGVHTTNQIGIALFFWRLTFVRRLTLVESQCHPSDKSSSFYEWYKPSPNGRLVALGWAHECKMIGLREISGVHLRSLPAKAHYCPLFSQLVAYMKLLFFDCYSKQVLVLVSIHQGASKLLDIYYGPWYWWYMIIYYIKINLNKSHVRSWWPVSFFLEVSHPGTASAAPGLGRRKSSRSSCARSAPVASSVNSPCCGAPRARAACEPGEIPWSPSGPGSWMEDDWDDFSGISPLNLYDKNGKSPILWRANKNDPNGPFSGAMLVYQRIYTYLFMHIESYIYIYMILYKYVIIKYIYIYTYIYIRGKTR